jgi:hypothetical protein
VSALNLAEVCLVMLVAVGFVGNAVRTAIAGKMPDQLVAAVRLPRIWALGTGLAGLGLLWLALDLHRRDIVGPPGLWWLGPALTGLGAVLAIGSLRPRLGHS